MVAVANDLEIRLPTSAERTDADIAAAASRTLEWDTLVPGRAPRNHRRQGWVTLKGEVEWQYQKVEAERAVRRLSGVRGATNQILLRPRLRIQPSSNELKRRIEAGLIRNAETDANKSGIRSVNKPDHDRPDVLTPAVQIHVLTPGEPESSRPAEDAGIVGK